MRTARVTKTLTATAVAFATCTAAAPHAGAAVTSPPSKLTINPAWVAPVFCHAIVDGVLGAGLLRAEKKMVRITAPAHPSTDAVLVKAVHGIGDTADRALSDIQQVIHRPGLDAGVEAAYTRLGNGLAGLVTTASAYHARADIRTFAAAQYEWVHSATAFADACTAAKASPGTPL
jgi:hypothetical protein